MVVCGYVNVQVSGGAARTVGSEGRHETLRPSAVRKGSGLQLKSEPGFTAFWFLLFCQKCGVNLWFLYSVSEWLMFHQLRWGEANLAYAPTPPELKVGEPLHR
jgi:hypothetical protein